MIEDRKGAIKSDAHELGSARNYAGSARLALLAHPIARQALHTCITLNRTRIVILCCNNFHWIYNFKGSKTKSGLLATADVFHAPALPRHLECFQRKPARCDERRNHLLAMKPDRASSQTIGRRRSTERQVDT